MQGSDMLLEWGNPAEDPRGFRRALGHYGTGVAVITAAGTPHPVGVTVNSFASVSLNPPLVLWSADNRSTSLPAFRAAGGFAVNILSSEQIDVSARFAKSGGDKFAGIDHDRELYDAPLLKGCVARLQCRRAWEFPGGDHLIFIGEVEHYARFAGTPLIFAQGRYGVPLDNPEIEQEIAPLGSGGHPYTFLTLLRRAYLARASAFKREASSSGLTVNESRVLYHLDVSGPLAPAELARIALLDQVGLDDAVRSLSARALVRIGEDGAVANTDAGRDVIAALREVSVQAEASLTEGVPDDAVRAARQVLELFAQAR